MMDSDTPAATSLGTEKDFGRILFEYQPKEGHFVVLSIFATLLIVGGGLLACAMMLRMIREADKLPWFATRSECLSSLAFFAFLELGLLFLGGVFMCSVVQKIDYKLYLCEFGLCAESRWQRVALLWNEIESIEQSSIDAPVRLVKFAPDSMLPRVTVETLSLRGSDGTELSINKGQFPPEIEAKLIHALEEALGKSISWDIRDDSPNA